jgi:hypothetical protein
MIKGPVPKICTWLSLSIKSRKVAVLSLIQASLGRMQIYCLILVCCIPEMPIYPSKGFLKTLTEEFLKKPVLQVNKEISARFCPYLRMFSIFVSVEKGILKICWECSK